MVNDWARIERELNAEGLRTAGTRKQIWRWTAGARGWLDAQGFDVRLVGDGDMERFIREVPAGPGEVKNRSQRVWAFRALVEAARAVEPPRARSSGSAAARLDQVPARSPLGKAITHILGHSKSRADRARRATSLGTFLRWCDSRGLTVNDLWPGDIDRFRRDYLGSGRTSPGECVRMARTLIDILAQGPEATQDMSAPADGRPAW